MATTQQQLATSTAKAQRKSYDLTNGRDEMNLAEFPLFYLGQRIPANVKTLRYEHTVHDAARNRSHTRKLEIAGSDAYGLPTVTDADVLLALLLLAKQSTDFENATVSFSRYEIIEILGWDHSGKSYKRLNEAFRKWKSVTLFFDNGWWDKEASEWATEGFNILDHISINHGRSKKGQPDLRLSSCTFSSRFFGSLHCGNIKRLNLVEWFSMKLPTAKQMYRFLDKRFYKTSRLDFDIREFACEHVGLSRNYAPSKLKEKLKPAIAELVELGFINEMTPAQRYTKVSHGEWRINFTRSKRANISDSLTGTKVERAAARKLIKELTDRGMTPATAQSFVANQSFDNALIEQKIEMLDWLIDRDPQEAPKQKGGWLAKAIKDDYQPPAGFQSKAERQRLQQAKIERQQQLAFTKAQSDEAERIEREEDAKREAANNLAIDTHLSSLLPAERDACIEEAIAKQVPLIQKNARRELRAGKPDIYLQLALSDHILPLLKSEAVR